MKIEKHRWLVSGQIVVQVDDGMLMTRTMNAVISTKDKKIRVINIAEAQAAIHQQYVKAMPEGQEINVVDIPLLPFTYLGLMSEADFQEGAEHLSQAGSAAADGGETLDTNSNTDLN